MDFNWKSAVVTEIRARYIFGKMLFSMNYLNLFWRPLNEVHWSISVLFLFYIRIGRGKIKTNEYLIFRVIGGVYFFYK